MVLLSCHAISHITIPSLTTVALIFTHHLSPPPLTHYLSPQHIRLSPSPLHSDFHHSHSCSPTTHPTCHLSPTSTSHHSPPRVTCHPPPPLTTHPYCSPPLQPCLPHLLTPRPTTLGLFLSQLTRRRRSQRRNTNHPVTVSNTVTCVGP